MPRHEKPEKKIITIVIHVTFEITLADICTGSKSLTPVSELDAKNTVVVEWRAFKRLFMQIKLAFFIISVIA